MRVLQESVMCYAPDCVCSLCKARKRIAELEAEVEYRAERDETPVDAEWLVNEMGWGAALLGRDCISGDCPNGCFMFFHALDKTLSLAHEERDQSCLAITAPTRGQVRTLCRVLGVGR